MSSDKTHLVVNAFGVDRPGMVADLSNLVLKAGGNVSESQAGLLGKHFALMMLVTVPSSNAASLQTSIANVTDMKTAIFETEDPKKVQVTPKIGYSAHFTLAGANEPGMMHTLSTVLLKYGLSIDKMETSEEDAPFGGTTLFIMEGIANAHEPLVKGFDSNKIRDELTALGDSMNCDITFEDMHDDDEDEKDIV
jgi:glycine cleavage system transcriptional repressor